MTLQFVGGLLDESEVHNATANIAQANVPLAQIAAAPPTPNNAPGRQVDIDEQPDPKFRLVPMPSVPAEVTEFQKAAQEALEKVSGTVLLKAAGEEPGDRTATAAVAQVEQAAPRRRRKKSASADIPESQQSTTLQTVVEEARKFETTSVAYPPAGSGEPALSIAPEVMKAILSPEPRAVVALAPAEPASAPAQAASAVEAKPVEPPAPAAPKADLPSADQQKVYRARWSEYVNKRLSKEGKMVPTEGVGGVSTKLRKFVLHLLPEVKENESLTVAQWETVLTYLDDKYEASGAEELVKFIDNVIK
jgi:hypothetical protein